MKYFNIVTDNSKKINSVLHHRLGRKKKNQGSQEIPGIGLAFFFGQSCCILNLFVTVMTGCLGGTEQSSQQNNLVIRSKAWIVTSEHLRQRNLERFSPSRKIFDTIQKT